VLGFHTTSGDYICSDVSEERDASIFRVNKWFRPELHPPTPNSFTLKTEAATSFKTLDHVSHPTQITNPVLRETWNQGITKRENTNCYFVLIQVFIDHAVFL